MKTIMCFLLLSALVLSAAELSGKWSGSFDITNSNGETKADMAYMDIKEKGGVITGTAGPSADQQWPISKGKLEGQKMTFEVAADGGTLLFDLTYDGEAIQGTCSGTGGGGEKMSAKVHLKRTA